MTPEIRAARDRLAAFLCHPGVRRDVEPGDPADVIAVITGRLDMPRLYKSDLRLLLAALDERETSAGPDLVWARVQVEQAAAKYEEFAERETNPLTKTAMQFAARIMRAEFLGQDGERPVNGRFTETTQSAQGAT